MKYVTFLSDFGSADPYIAEVRAVLLRAAPLQMLDLTHEVPPFAVQWGAFQLLRSYRYFPKGTIHLAVVDPGVGTERKGLWVKTRDYQFVGPDNGLLRWAVEACEKVEGKKAVYSEIPIPIGVGPTFHGRDVFAPFVVDILKGKKRKLKTLKTLQGKPFPTPVQQGDKFVGEILSWDRFGNLATSHESDPKVKMQARLAGSRELIPEVANYMEIEKGKVALIRGSHGFWEIAGRASSAANILRAQPGDPVTLLPIATQP